jgi:hypothetical protein
MTLWSNTDAANSKPKNLSSDQKDATVGIDAVEAAANGLTAGWNLKTVGTGGREGRVFHEVLVAMGSMTGDNDTVAPEITISGQPSNTSVVAPATATFSVTATRTGTGSLSYQWQKQEGGAGTWANITDATTNTYTTGATAVEADNGDKYRVIVSLTGAESVTSSAATLTVTAE